MRNEIDEIIHGYIEAFGITSMGDTKYLLRKLMQDIYEEMSRQVTIESPSVSRLRDCDCDERHD